MQRVSRFVYSLVGCDFLGHRDRKLAKSVSHILNRCIMIALTDVKALQ